MGRPKGIARLLEYGRLMRRRAREGHLPIARQALEIAALGVLTGNGPGYYLTGAFYRRDLPWRDKRMHLGARSYRARLDTLNPERARPFSQNKLVEKCLLTALGFPTPRLIGLLHPESGRSTGDGELRNSGQLAALLGRHSGARLVFKVLSGWGGRGFIAVEIREGPGGEVQVADLCDARDARPVSAARFYEQLLEGAGASGRVIEEYFEQHPAMAELNPSSVNTCRVWVARPRTAPARVVLAYLRVGRRGSLVDNHHAGGLVAPIDLETGETRAAMDGLPTRAEFDRHPDHGAALAGRTIPFWPEAKALATACLEAFPGLRFAGVDVAIGPGGPALLELNPSPDREGAAQVGIPSATIVPGD